MSNRLFFTVPLVLMGVLSGCNSIPVQNLFGNSNGSNLQSEALTYAREVLQCKSSEYMPTTQAISVADQSSRNALIQAGKDAAKIFPELAHAQNCDLVSRAYISCGDGFDRYDCIQGYVYKSVSYDKKDVLAVVLAKKKEDELKEANRIKAIEEAKLLEKQKYDKQQRLKFYELYSCSENVVMPSEKAIKLAKDSNYLDLESLGKHIASSTSEKQNCAALDIADKQCSGFNKHDCIKGFFYLTAKIDKPDLFTQLEKELIRGQNLQKIAEQKAEIERVKQQQERDRAEAFKRHVESLANNETKLNADLYWYIGQINERKLKLSKLQSGTKEYAETVKELEHLNNELIPLNLAKDLIKQREQDATNRRIAQERDYQQRQLDQQRQAQQAQLEYQRKQLELQRQQAEALEEANNPFSLQNRLKSLEDMNRRNKPVNCSKVGGVVTCF